MKKVFLLILSAGIMMTACKKDTEMKNNLESVSLKEYGIQTSTPPPQDTLPYYYLAATNVMIDSILCDMYVNSTDPNSIVYIPKTENKALFRKFKWNAWVNSSTHKLECNGAALKECYNRSDGTIVVKRGAYIEIR
jgi:hypothetical protein